MDSDQITGVYGKVGGLPAPVSAHVSEEQLPEVRIYTVTAEWIQSDLVQSSRLRYSQQWTLIADSNNHQSIRTVLPPGPCAPVSGELLSELSPVHGLRAVVRETGSQQLLEIWDRHGLRKCLNLSALNIHGRVYDDSQFGCLSWSECERKLLYVAESSRSSSAETRSRESASRKDRSVYREDWGEALTGKSVPVLCVVDLHHGAVDVLQGVPPDVSPGQVSFIQTQPGWTLRMYIRGQPFSVLSQAESRWIHVDLPAGSSVRASQPVPQCAAVGPEELEDLNLVGCCQQTSG
ncbi:hypothetical protein AMECASPLE_013308, partial [Ameca splendens]